MDYIICISLIFLHFVFAEEKIVTYLSARGQFTLVFFMFGTMQLGRAEHNNVLLVTVFGPAKIYF